MLQLFKKTVTAERIQRELVDKSDELMTEVRTILSKEVVKSPAVSRLMALGFDNAKGVQEHKESERKQASAKAKADLIEKHSLKYPGLKFIDNDTLTEVCKKYGLVCGGIERYKGDVPDWALGAIERHKEAAGKKEEAQDRPEAKSQFLIGTDWGTDPYRSYLRQMQWMMQFIPVWMDSGWRNSPPSVGDLCIAAPAKDMVVRSNEKVENHRIRVEDPIVYFNVEGGVMVVCAWGEEGQDPKVFNTQNN